MIPLKKLKSSFEMPTLGLGTWLMGGDVARVGGEQDVKDVAAIRAAIKMGYTHIDTAEIYADGHAEELVGQAIQGYARDKLFIASKAKQGNHTPELLARALDGSLKRLGLDYLDLYYLHRPTLGTPFEETAKGLNAAVKSGKIRHIGVCNFSIQNFEKLQSYLDTPIVANQVHYNLVFREPEIVDMFNHAAIHDYFVMAWRPLRFKKRNPQDGSLDADAWERGAFPLLDEMADKYKTTNVQVALNWVTHHPNALTLIKSSRPEHLREAMGSFGWNLLDSDYVKLQKDFQPQSPVSDTIPLI